MRKFTRLIKSEIYDGFKRQDDYCEVFINPTQKEINSLAKNNIRGAISKNGDKYLWTGDVLHGSINEYVKNKVDVSYFTFAIDVDGWYCHLRDKLNYDECQKIMKNNLNYLAQIGDLNNELELTLIDGNFDFKSVNEFINSEKP